MRPGRLPTLHWAISVNSRPQSCVADRPRATHSVHSCTVCLKLKLTRVHAGIAGGLRHQQSDHDWPRRQVGDARSVLLEQYIHACRPQRGDQEVVAVQGIGKHHIASGEALKQGATDRSRLFNERAKNWICKVGANRVIT